MRKKLLPMALLALAFAAPLLARNALEQQKIDYLVHAVADLKGAHFIRNGVAYDAAKAADHLQRKLRYAGERIATAQQFIDEVGTASSTSGDKYLIELQGGKRVESAAFLREKLAEFPLRAP